MFSGSDWLATAMFSKETPSGETMPRVSRRRSPRVFVVSFRCLRPGILCDCAGSGSRSSDAALAVQRRRRVLWEKADECNVGGATAEDRTPAGHPRLNCWLTAVPRKQSAVVSIATSASAAEARTERDVGTGDSRASRSAENNGAFQANHDTFADRSRPVEIRNESR